MKLIELLSLIDDVANENKLSKPYIVGGFVRDLLLRKIENIKDIDITCGDKTSLLLAKLVSKKLEGSTILSFDDGHSKLSYGDTHIDFSNNFIIPNIKKILEEKNILYTKPIYEEIYK